MNKEIIPTANSMINIIRAVSNTFFSSGVYFQENILEKPRIEKNSCIFLSFFIS